jgi:uncharacterized membrane protein
VRRQGRSAAAARSRGTYSWGPGRQRVTAPPPPPPPTPLSRRLMQQAAAAAAAVALGSGGAAGRAPPRGRPARRGKRRCLPVTSHIKRQCRSNDGGACRLFCRCACTQAGSAQRPRYSGHRAQPGQREAGEGNAAASRPSRVRAPSAQRTPSPAAKLRREPCFASQPCEGNASG